MQTVVSILENLSILQQFDTVFAIAFDMVVKDLKTYYGEPYNNAYYDISVIMEQFGFYRTQGSVYLTTNTDFSNLVRAMNALKATPWFTAAVRDIRAFRVENWSDFTQFMKE